jgi:hypothetical protein
MSKLIKLLWCKVVGHKPSEKEYSKEFDGSMESYNICDRCGRESNRVTLYDCTNFTPDDLINVVNVDEKAKEEEDMYKKSKPKQSYYNFKR